MTCKNCGKDIVDGQGISDCWIHEDQEYYCYKCFKELYE